jgi:uncharacterized phiE125 gp8 family phage protein
MSLTLITPPVVMPVTLAELRAHLRVDDADQEHDALIVGYARSAVERLDGAAGVLGRALMRQEWELRFDQFCQVIRLPLPPLSEVISVTYLDLAGDPQVLNPSDYIVAGIGGDGTIRPALGTSFPPTAALPAAVRILFAAGADNPNGVPEQLRLAIMEITRATYDGCSADEAVRDLIGPYRASWVF